MIKFKRRVNPRLQEILLHISFGNTAVVTSEIEKNVSEFSVSDLSLILKKSLPNSKLAAFILMHLLKQKTLHQVRPKILKITYSERSSILFYRHIDTRLVCKYYWYCLTALKKNDSAGFFNHILSQTSLLIDLQQETFLNTKFNFLYEKYKNCKKLEPFSEKILFLMLYFSSPKHNRKFYDSIKITKENYPRLLSLGLKFGSNKSNKKRFIKLLNKYQIKDKKKFEIKTKAMFQFKNKRKIIDLLNRVQAKAKRVRKRKKSHTVSIDLEHTINNLHRYKTRSICRTLSRSDELKDVEIVAKFLKAAPDKWLKKRRVRKKLSELYYRSSVKQAITGENMYPIWGEILNVYRKSFETKNGN